MDDRSAKFSFGKQSTMNKLSRSLLSTIAVLLACGFSVAQQPATLSSDAAPAQPRRARQPQPDKPFELQAMKPEFWKLFDKNAKLETMGTNLGGTEGPVWDPAGFLWVSDERGNRIFKLYPDGHTEDMVSLVDPDGSTFDKQHRLLSTASGLRAIIRLSADGKSFATVVDHYNGKKLNTPNDIVIGPDGAVYFTDPIIDMRKGQEQEQPVSVYRMDAKNNLTRLAVDQPAPNGLAFSPNGKYLYIDDDDTKNIMRYDFHKDGTVSNGKIFGDMKDAGNRGVPDGMKVDKKGNLFVSGPNGIWVWNSKGEHIGTVQMPHGMANLAWGGPDYSKLYVTARNTVYVLPTKTHGFIPYNRK
jgi:gluconolactonase